MRWWPITFALVACAMTPPPKQVIFPTLDPGDTYNTRVANLRTTLARADIKLRLAGRDETFETASCDPLLPAQSNGTCVRCVLAGEHTPMDGAVIEAATEAFRRYPTTALAAAGIEHVAVCTEIVYTEPEEVDHPAGVADPASRGLLLSVKHFIAESTYRSGGDFTVDDIVHHEVYHLLENAHSRALMAEDAEWEALNPLGFHYSKALYTEPRQAGFVSAYAMTQVAEDKASVYGHLMAHPYELCELAKTDEVLRAKLAIVWRRAAAALGTDGFMRAAAPCVSVAGWIDVTSSSAAVRWPSLSPAAQDRKLLRRH